MDFQFAILIWLLVSLPVALVIGRAAKFASGE